MAYRANPFLERRSEETNTPDQEFVRFFSPKILERLPDDVFKGGVHVFRSPPGAGKTTLFRAFSPTALRAFWHAKKSPDMSETFQRLAEEGIIDELAGPQLLGVMLSCASGYADLPPGALYTDEGIFRALVNCRVVLRALRSVAVLVDATDADFKEITLEYGSRAQDLKRIPLMSSALELLTWAEERERTVYEELDSFAESKVTEWPSDVRFEGLLWLQEVKFKFKGRQIGERRLLMIDDMHKLKRRQREMLIEEMVEFRPAIPVWLAERNVALGNELLSQGARSGRDLHEVDLGELWGTGGSRQTVFQGFAQNILERRLSQQIAVPQAAFSQYLASVIQAEDVRDKLISGIETALDAIAPYRTNAQYSGWILSVDKYAENKTVESFQEILLILIRIARYEGKRQGSLLLGPLSTEELEEKDSSKDEGAADIFMHEFANVPYYYGFDRLCAMATHNAEELLALAAVLYEGIKARQVLRKDPALSTIEQDRLLFDAAKKKLAFIPKTHSAGSQAQKMIDGIGKFCRSRTFEPNAPYAPGVTGVRLSNSRMRTLEMGSSEHKKEFATLQKVLSECVAENLLVKKMSAASTSREAGTVFYLNRTLCAAFGLPMGTGGWQDVTIDEMMRWMLQGPSNTKQAKLAIT
jgi:hypothetical protein